MEKKMEKLNRNTKCIQILYKHKSLSEKQGVGSSILPLVTND